MWVTQYGCWEPNLGSLSGPQALSTLLKKKGERESSLSLFLYKDLHISNGTAINLHPLPFYLPPTKGQTGISKLDLHYYSQGLLGFQEIHLILRASVTIQMVSPTQWNKAFTEQLPSDSTQWNLWANAIHDASPTSRHLGNGSRACAAWVLWFCFFVCFVLLCTLTICF